MDLTVENLNELIAQTQRQDVEIRFLKQKIQFLMGKLFGASSEKISPDQLALAFGEESAIPGTPEAEAERPRAGNASTSRYLNGFPMTCRSKRLSLSPKKCSLSRRPSVALAKK